MLLVYDYHYCRTLLLCFFLSHPDSSFMRARSFPHYNDLAIIWGKDRANGKAAKAPGNIL